MANKTTKKINRKTIKEKANKILNENLWNYWKGYLIIFLISILFGIFSSFIDIKEHLILYIIVNIIYSILVGPLTVGFTVYVLNIVRKKKFSIKDLFKSYRNFLLIMVSMLLVLMFSLLWSILLIIPGIIAILSYSMVTYLLADKDPGGIDTIKKSKSMMKGYKWDYFVFNLSFIGWIFLGFITFGLALLYIAPFVMISQTLYYEELRRIKNKKR